MKTPLLGLLVCLVLCNLSVAQSSGKISQEERTFLLNYLKVGEAELIATISNMDQEQWTHKPAVEVWSPAQCMTHILTAEMGSFKNIQQLLEKPAENRPALKEKDAWLIGKINDRGTKVKTPLDNDPETYEQAKAIDMLKASRKELYSFLQNKKLPLRNHIGKSPYGPADTYQLFLVIAAHGMRHHAQMVEVLDSSM